MLGALFTPQVGAQQQNEIVLSIDYDGLQPNGDAPFAANTDGQHTPGFDDNQNNNVVLANDLIGYRIDWNVNELDGSTVTIRATLPEGMRWSEDPANLSGAPSGCVDALSSITGNTGRDLVCVTDAEHEGSNGVFHPVAEVGSQYDGTPLELTASIESGELPPVDSNTVTTYASARPKADWIKGADVLDGSTPPVVVAQKPSEEIHGIVGPNGETGRIWLYPLRLQPVGSVLGAEKMDDSKPIDIYDHGYELPPGAILATGLVPDTPTGTPRTACGAYDGIGAFPLGSTGTWTCTDLTGTVAGVTYPLIHVQITGHDTTQLPPLNGDTTYNTTTMLAGQIAFWVPESAMDSFPVDVYNGMSGTTDPVTVPTDLDPIQIWGSAPASFDEAGIVNNFAYWKATAVPAVGGPGRAFRHNVKYIEGPYREASRKTPAGWDYRFVDSRITTVGGLGISVPGTGTNVFDPGWGQGYAGPMQAHTPRGNELVVVAELDHVQSSPATPYYYEPSSLCVAIDTTHQEVVPLPATFDVTEIADNHPFAFAARDSVGVTTESPNTGPLAQVHVGGFPNAAYHVFSYAHGVEMTQSDIPYVVEFASAATPLTNKSEMHGVTCNNADADARGWVDATGDVSVFDPNGDGRYEDITNARLRVTGPMKWTGSDLHPASSTWGTAINLNLQVRVKDDPIANAADQELFVYSSRAYTPTDTQGDPDAVVVWDPATMANPGTPTCTNPTNTVWRDHFGDGVDHNTIVPSGWCNLPYYDDGASSTDLADSSLEFGGGGEDAYELCQTAAYMASGCYPRMVHADKVKIVEAKLAIAKRNMDGPNDRNVNGDLIDFEIKPSIVGSSLDTLSDVILTDTLPAQYEFVAFTQPPTTAINTNATTPPNNDGTPLAAPVCDIVGQVITCNFGTQVGGWSDLIIYQVRLRDAGADKTYTNTVRLNGNDALSGLPKDQVVATAKSFTPGGFEEAGIVKAVDTHIGPCSTHPTDDPAPADWGDDCSIITPGGGLRFNLTAVNQGLTDLADYRIIDVLPHLGDEVELASATLTGDGRIPESAFAGTLEFVAAAGTATTFLYSMDDPNTISRDPDVTEAANTWCPIGGAAVFGAGACPAVAADVTAVRADLGALKSGETRIITLDLLATDNECGDVYTNNFGSRTPNILLPTRSNDVTAMVGFCEPAIDIEKDTNGDQADNIDEDVNGDGILDAGEDTNDPNGVLDSAAPAGSNIGQAIPAGGAVTWTYVVTNTGDVPLANATVADSDPAVTPDCDIDGDGVFDGTNVIPLLMPGASITCQATGTAVVGQYMNMASVGGEPVLPDFSDPAVDPNDPTTWPTDPAAYSAPVDPTTGEPALPASIDDEDPSHYWGIDATPAVGIEKDTNGDQADATAGPTIQAGDPVTWTYVVTNTGTLPITPATVADSDPALTVVCAASLADAGGDAIIDIFLPGESVTCTATGVATGGAYENTATVSGPTSLPTGSCVCDPTDPATWPTDADAYAANVDPATGEPIGVEATDDSHYTGVGPAIDIEKDTNGVQSDEAPGESVIYGAPVTWTYVVTNTGTTALSNAAVSDSDPAVTVVCDIDGDGVFDPTNVIPFLLPAASVTCEATGIAQVGPYMNSASVSGTPQAPDFDTCGCDPADPSTWPTDPADYSDVVDENGDPVAPVSDGDDSHYVGLAAEPAIDIEKDTNGAQSDVAPGESVTAGSPLTWTYVVTNTGSTALSAASVSDSDPAVTVDCDVDGDGAFDGTNVIPFLLPGASVTCQGMGIAQAGPYMNTASVSGTPQAPDFDTCGCDSADPSTWPTDPADYGDVVDENGDPVGPVTDADDSHYDGVVAEAAIDIEKDTNGVQSDTTPGESISVGAPVTWTYVVTNTGVTTLANATVTDSQGVTVSCDIDGDGVFDGTNIIPILLPGASVTCEGTGTAVGGAYMNNASVAGSPVVPDPATCGCDPADQLTWPTDPAAFTPAVDKNGEPLADVADEDASHYTGTQVLGGTVWDDDNNDGIQDGNEVVHAGVVVELLDVNGDPVLDANGEPITAVTDANGNYEFNVPPGQYMLRFTPPAGLSVTPGLGGESLADPFSATTGVIDLTPGAEVLGINVGLVPVFDGVLAFTGTESRTVVQFALLLVLLGLVTLAAVHTPGVAGAARREI